MNQIQIFVGSIQGTLFSYNFSLNDGELYQSFNTQDHIGKLTSIHLDNTHLMATSGQDENIKIYDLSKKKCLSNIFGIKGIAKKILSTNKYFVSAHETGQVFIYGKQDFCVYHKINVFKHPVIDIDIHPSGLFLVCLSSTNRFSLWNLSTCANIFHKKVQTQIENVAFLDDSNILLISRDCFYVFNLKTLSIDKLIQIEERDKINDFQIVKYQDNIILICGTEKGNVYFFDQEVFYSQELTDQYIAKFKAYDCRVKKLKLINNILVTISTEGDLSIWDIQEILDLDQKYQSLTLDQFSSLTDYKIETRLVLLDCKAVQQDTKEKKQKEKVGQKQEEKIEKKKRPQKEKTKKIKKLHQKNKSKKNQLIHMNKLYFIMTDINSVEHLVFYIDQFHDPQTPQETIKKLDKMFRNLKKNPQLFEFVNRIFTEDQFRQKEKLLIHICKSLKLKLRTRFNDLKEEHRLQFYEYLLQFVNSQYCKRSIQDDLIDCMTYIFARIWKIDQNIFQKSIENLSMDNALLFLQKLPLIVLQRCVNIEKKSLQEYEDYILTKVFPYTIQMQNQSFQQIQNMVSTEKILAMQRNYEILEFWVELLDTKKQIFSDFENAIMQNPFVLKSFEDLNDLVLNESCEKLLLQIGIYIDRKKIAQTNFFAMIDQFLSNLEHINKDNNELVKILTYFFDNFFDKISNKEKLFFFLVQSLDQQPTIQALRAFKKFLKSIHQQNAKSEYIKALEILWKMLPPLIKLDEEDLQTLSNEFVYEFKKEEWDDSLEDKLSLRKSCKSLFSEFVYFLNDLTILDFVYNEINTLQNEESYEALVYIMSGILTKFNQIQQTDLQQNKLMDKIVVILFELCNKSFTNLKLRTKLSLRKLLEKIISNDIQQVYLNENFEKLLKFNDLCQKNLSSGYKKQAEQVIKCYIQKCNKQMFILNVQWFLELYNQTRSKNIIKEILIVSEKVDMQQFQLNYFKQVWSEIEKLFEQQKQNMNLIIDKIDLLSLIIDKSSNKILSFDDWKITMGYLVPKFPQNFHYQEAVCDYFTKYIKNNPQINIEFYKDYLDVIIQYFQNFMIPSYLFVIEQILKYSYKQQHLNIMQIYYNNICDIMLKNFEADNFDGKYYDQGNNVKMSIYDKFVDFNQNSLFTFEDLFDDFYGLLKQFQKNDLQFLYNYPNAKMFLNFTNKIFIGEYIYNVPTMIQYMRQLSLDKNLMQNNHDFSQQIFHKCFKLLFNEFFDVTTTKQIFTIILNIIDCLYPSIVEQDLKQIFENSTFLTEEIKEYFYLIIKKCKLQNEKLSFKNPDIESLFDEFNDYLKVNAEENYDEINQQKKQIIKTMKFILYSLIIFQSISCTKRVITEERYQQILEANMQNLPELVTSIDYNETIEAIQRETFDLFGIFKQAQTIQEALKSYYYADLDEIAKDYKGLDDEDKISKKFEELIYEQVQKQFNSVMNITQIGIQKFYGDMIPYIKQYNTALIRLNIQMKDTSFQTDAKISSIIARYLQSNRKQDLIKKIKAEGFQQILTFIEQQQDILEQSLKDTYIPRAIYYIQIRLDQLIDFSYKIRIMAYDISRNESYPKNEHNEEEVMKFQYLIKRSKTILEIFLEANKSGDLPHSLLNPENKGDEQQVANRKRKDYLFQTLIEEKEYIMQQENNTLMSKYYGQFLASLQKVVQRFDDNPQDAFYMKKYLTYQNEILPPDETFQQVMNYEATQIPQHLEFIDHMNFFDQQVFLLKIADQLAYNKEFEGQQVEQLRGIYHLIAGLPLKYFENKSILFFVNHAGCFGDLKVNIILYDSICQFRLQYTVEQTTTNKYAVGRFLETFVDNQYQKKKDLDDEISVQFSNMYFYLKFQLMFNIAGFVPQNAEGKYYFQPVTDKTIQFIDQNVNDICVVNKGGGKLFLKRVYLITSDLMKNKISPKMQLQLEYLTNRNVDKENQVYVDLRLLQEMFKITVDSSQVLDQQILAKIDKPDEFIINAQFDDDTFQRTHLQDLDEDENQKTFQRLSTFKDKNNLTFNIGPRTGTGVFRPNQTFSHINVNDMSGLYPINNKINKSDDIVQGKNAIKILKDKKLNQQETDIAEDPQIMDILLDMQKNNGGKLEIENPDGSITRMTYVQVVPKKSPCFEKLQEF